MPRLLISLGFFPLCKYVAKTHFGTLYSTLGFIGNFGCLRNLETKTRCRQATPSIIF